MRRGGFTILELTIVLAVGTALTTLGVVSVAGVISQSRFNEQRARLFLDVREARDRASNSLSAVAVVEVAGNKNAFRIVPIPVCNPGAVTAQMALAPTHVFKALDNGPAGGDRGACFDAASVSNAAFGGFAGLDFVNADGSGNDSRIDVGADGNLINSWNDFPAEGAFESASCDIDHDPQCGNY